MFAYCGNDPVNKTDPTGEFGLVAAIIATGTVVGGLLGAFNAAATGGNVIESMIEGALTGAFGATCGILLPSTFTTVAIASVGGSLIDVGVQVAAQKLSHQDVDIDIGRAIKTGIQTGIGVWVPQFGDAAKVGVDAFATALIWAEASTMITIADVIFTNVTTTPTRTPTPSRRTPTRTPPSSRRTPRTKRTPNQYALLA